MLKKEFGIFVLLLALGAFIVLEFLGSSISPVLGAVGGALNLAAFAALALTIWRTPREEWQPAVPLSSRRPAVPRA